MNTVDITVIGSGAAATVTLIEFFDRLLKQGDSTQKLTIAVIEKNQDLWKGIPYGSRSSVNALTITSVHDFLHENERPLFYHWLKSTKSDWSAYYSEHGGITAARWLEKNLPLIDNNEWETVYVPRFLFGNYLKKKLTGLLKAAEEKKLIEVKVIQAEAIDVKKISGGLYEIVLEHPDNSLSQITTHKLVIAAGSAPVKKMCEITGDNALYINDMYEPSANENIKTIQTALSKTTDAGDRNILIIGSNASSIEILYLLEGLPALRALINKIVIISTSGILPYHISTETLESHPIPALDKLKAEGNYTIKTLSEAAGTDLKLALQNGANMDYVATIISSTLKMMEVLGEEAKKEFYCIYGLKLRDSFRRSGPEYKNGSQVLIDQDQVLILKGRFQNTQQSENGVLINYTDTATGKQQTHPLNFKAIINCSGSDNLDQSSSRLLYNLTNNHICRMNLSGKGFEVNEKFEAAPNLYIMGPLLGGNVNKLIHFWQLENVSRLTYLAPYLVTELIES